MFWAHINNNNKINCLNQTISLEFLWVLALGLVFVCFGFLGLGIQTQTQNLFLFFLKFFLKFFELKKKIEILILFYFF